VALDEPGNFPVQERLETLGVSLLSEWDALVFLYRHGASLASVAHIARLLGHAEAALGITLDRLESLGLVRHSFGAEGLRLYRFSLPTDPVRLSCFVELIGLGEKRSGRLQLLSHLKHGRSEPPMPAGVLDLPSEGGMIMNESNVVRTGIAGLDDILIRGIPRTNLILVEGTVGSGKTILGTEFIYRGITQFNETGIIVLFETSPYKLIRDAAAFGWNLAALQEQRKLQIIFTSPQALEQEMSSTNSLLLETAVEIGALRIFIDGIGLLHRAPDGHPMPASGPGSYRELLQQLLEGITREHLTAMISHEVSLYPGSQLTLESAEILVDTVIRLTQSLHGQAPQSQH
jgi:KaiC/GvpD/RAD55 family RecA-like ATPase